MRVLVVLLMALIAVVTAQKGKECSSDTDCEEYQSCSFGYCKCSHGFIKIKNSCYRDGKKHGEECEDDIQCSSDHRLGCKEQQNGDKICQCNKYFEYDEDLKECINARNLTDILQLLQEQWKSYEKIENEAKKVFVGLVIAGLLSIALGIIFAGGCIIYGCFIPRWKMQQFPEEDFQTTPLCPMSNESPALVRIEEPTTPAAAQPTNLGDSSKAGDLSSLPDAIV